MNRPTRHENPRVTAALVGLIVHLLDEQDARAEEREPPSANGRTA